MQRADHRPRQRPLARQYIRYALLSAEHARDVLLAQSALLHAMQDGINGVGLGEYEPCLLVVFNQLCQQFLTEAVAGFRCGIEPREARDLRVRQVRTGGLVRPTNGTALDVGFLVDIKWLG